MFAIERKTVRDQVHEYLREDILSGRLAPGTRLVEAQLAEEYGVSRTPVREVMPALESEGLLEGLDGGGYRVRELNWGDVEELSAIRAANEVLAAGLAAQRGTDELVVALEENLRLSEAAIRNGTPSSFAERDAEFHSLLVGASGGTRMLVLCQILRRDMIRYRVQSFHVEAEVLRAFAGHVQIVDALKKKDASALQEAVRRHIEEAREIIRRCSFAAEGESVSA